VRKKPTRRQHDCETRERLLTCAAQLFAERGFKKVTVRAICRAAHANVAAVNYHFGDKGGLYREVLQAAVEIARTTREAARRAGEGQPPDEQLRRYVQVVVSRVLAPGPASWIHRLITREMADPTPAFDALVDQGIRPRVDDLSAIVAAILDCPPNDVRVMRAVASIQAQWLVYLPNPVLSRLRPRFHPRVDDVDQIAAHIAEFSLAGIRAVGGPTASN
jgi:AcrR family transcriptional regulator